jgi:hypothetical protein
VASEWESEDGRNTAVTLKNSDRRREAGGSESGLLTLFLVSNDFSKLKIERDLMIWDTYLESNTFLFCTTQELLNRDATAGKIETAISTN